MQYRTETQHISEILEFQKAELSGLLEAETKVNQAIEALTSIPSFQDSPYTGAVIKLKGHRRNLELHARNVKSFIEDTKFDLRHARTS